MTKKVMFPLISKEGRGSRSPTLVYFEAESLKYNILKPQEPFKKTKKKQKTKTKHVSLSELIPCLP